MIAEAGTGVGEALVILSAHPMWRHGSDGITTGVLGRDRASLSVVVTALRGEPADRAASVLLPAVRDLDDFQFEVFARRMATAYRDITSLPGLDDFTLSKVMRSFPDGLPRCTAQQERDILLVSAAALASGPLLNHRLWLFNDELYMPDGGAGRYDYWSTFEMRGPGRHLVRTNPGRIDEIVRVLCEWTDEQCRGKFVDWDHIAAMLP